MHCSLVWGKHHVELQVGKSATASRALACARHAFLRLALP